MVVEVKRQLCDGHMLKWLIAAGLAWLEHNHKTVNAMNVFPVPDGDTGTNMRLTLQKAYDEIAHHDEPHIGLVSHSVAKGALLGARGNSGVILSQLLAGFAQEVRGHELLDLALFARACERAVQTGYQAVQTPVEGTILTVAREASAALSAFAATSLDLTEGFAVFVDAGKAALERTPDMLPILKKAGVVDSGGQGLVIILEGMARLLSGETVKLNGHQPTSHPSASSPSDSQHEIPEWQTALIPEDEEGYGYDVQFLIRGQDLNVAKIRADIEAMGWSTLVVGDESLVKVHVHVHDPGVPLSYGIRIGTALDDVVVENMQLQYQGYVARRAATEEHPESDEISEVDGIAVIAVASGKGLRHLFRDDLGAVAVVSGGQTMNPSTEDFLAYIDRIPNNEIILLPNNKNIILAAEQAAALARDKQVRVIPTRSIPQGVGAMVAYLSLRENAPFQEVVQGMRDAMHEIITCEFTTATRDVDLNGVEVTEGQYIALVDGQLVLAGDVLTQLIAATLTKAGGDDYELITVYYGSDVHENEALALIETLKTQFMAQEFNVVYGGQPLYPYLMSLE